MSQWIALDVGGSKILGGLFDDCGEILTRKKVKTYAARGTAFVQSQIELVIDELLDQGREVAGICVISPGIVLGDDRVEFCPNVPFEHYPLGEILRDRYRLPVKLGNDVSMALYGEWRRLKTDMKHAVGIFVGTGVGGGLIFNDQLYQGKGAAGEIGHMTVEPGGLRCGCDNAGCLEAYAGKAGMQRALLAQKRRGRTSLLFDYVSDEGSMIKSSAFREGYRQGDELTLELLERSAHYLGIAVANLTNLLHPDLFIMGGGMMEDMGDFYVPRILKSARHHVLPQLAKDIRLEISQLGDDAGIIGGYYLIREAL